MAWAYSNVAATTPYAGFQRSIAPSMGSPLGLRRSHQPPTRYDKSPHLGPAAFLSFSRCVFHLGQSNKKWRTVSGIPQVQFAVSEAWILCRYPLSLHLPVRSWQSIEAWFLFNLSYRRLVCMPGSASSRRLMDWPAEHSRNNFLVEVGLAAEERATDFNSFVLGGCRPFSVDPRASWCARSFPVMFLCPGTH